MMKLWTRIALYLPLVAMSFLLLSNSTLAAKKSSVSLNSHSAKKANVDPKAKSKLKPLKDIAAKAIQLLVEQDDVVVRGKHGVRIHVVNNSDRAVIFNGDDAIATLNGIEHQSSIMSEFDDLSGSQPTFISELDAMDPGKPEAISIRGIQSYNDLLKKPKPTLDRFNRDDYQRKEADQTRFGQRILWPGDSSSGTIIFQSSEALCSSRLKIPICSFFDATDRAEASNK